MSGTSPELPVMIEGETLNGARSFAGLLDEGESLTGTPVVEEVNTNHLTITNAAVSEAALVIAKESVPAGKAVQFSVTGGTAGTTYRIRITVSTDSTPPQTFERYVRLRVAAN